MSQPTLAEIPGILLRTIVRLFARGILVIAAVLLILGTVFALGSLLLATWRTPRGRRTALLVDIVLLATELFKAHRAARDKVSHTDSPAD